MCEGCWYRQILMILFFVVIIMLCVNKFKKKKPTEVENRSTIFTVPKDDGKQTTKIKNTYIYYSNQNPFFEKS